MKKIIVIYNKKSGAADTVKEIKNEFRNKQQAPTYIELNKHTAQNLKKARATKSCVLVAAGGDGTVNAVVNLLEPGDVLGVIPEGTLNHFAKDADIPLTIPEAVEAILLNHTVKLDFAMAGEHRFINNSSIGVYPYFVRKREQYSKYILKWPAAIVALFQTIVRLPSNKLRLDFDGKQQTKKYTIVFIGNNSYGIHKPGFTNRASIYKGKLSVYTLKKSNRRRLLLSTIQALLGTASDMGEFESHFVENLKVYSKKPFWFSYDGEAEKSVMPLTFSIRPKGLTVIVRK